MKLAIRACFATLLLLLFVFAAVAQTTTTTTTSSTTTTVKHARSANDPRNTAPTVGTGGPTGGPTGLFTVYDGQVLRRGEFTFSAAWSNFDRDPGDLDITEIPVSFQVGLTNRIELFFNTDAYRGIKVNSPGNLSSFYLPNSRINGISPGAIVLAPGTAGGFVGQPIFRPVGTGPFVTFPYIGGSAGNFQILPFSGPTFGFPAGANAPIGPVRSGNNGADQFPGMGSVFGSILPGIVLQSTTINGAAVPTVYTTAPSYNPDAPFINRTWGESSFSTLAGGVKWRFTGLDNPVGLGVVVDYKWYMDKGDDFAAFNMLQRGSSPGGNWGDLAATFFADSRVAKWMNVSLNAGYRWTSQVKSDLNGSTSTAVLLDRPDELLLAAGVDFPVNKFFQPIGEFRRLQYIGARTPNVFENNPMEGLIGARVFPTRWFSIGGAYRHNFNQQDRDSLDNQDGFGQAVTRFVCPPSTQGVPVCNAVTTTSTITGVPAGFRPSTDPHGFMLQVTAGRRNARQAELINQAANVTALTLSDSEISLPCPAGFRSSSNACNDSTSINVATTAVDPENDVLTYNYTVSGGRVVGTGANVQWDVAGLQPGTYTITAGVDDGCGICGQTQTKTITIATCPDCVKICECPSLTVSGPAGITTPGETMTFTANVSGGSQDQVTYNWTVSAGTIESGQGTPSITVRTTREMAGSNVTATVNLGGLDPGCNCPGTANETGGVAPRPVANLVETVGKATNDDIKARVDNWYTLLNQNPSSQGYVINYGTPAQIKARRAQITKAISFRNYDPSRITFVDGPDNSTGIETRFYLVPPGADNPTP